MLELKEGDYVAGFWHGKTEGCRYLAILFKRDGGLWSFVGHFDFGSYKWPFGGWAPAEYDEDAALAIARHSTSLGTSIVPNIAEELTRCGPLEALVAFERSGAFRVHDHRKATN